MAATENTGKIRLRRGSTSEWTTGTKKLYEGQPGIEYLASGKARMKVGPETNPEGGETAWSSCVYVGSNPDVYTDTQIVNSDGHTVSASPYRDSAGVIRNIILSTSAPTSASVDNYPSGSVWLVYE